jgi:hypothetical protein
VDRQQRIAAKHYLQVTDEHFEHGTGKAAQKRRSRRTRRIVGNRTTKGAHLRNPRFC